MIQRNLTGDGVDGVQNWTEFTETDEAKRSDRHIFAAAKQRLLGLSRPVLLERRGSDGLAVSHAG
jgi:hypothetical protein